jgi:hypothetical protein
LIPDLSWLFSPQKICGESFERLARVGIDKKVEYDRWFAEREKDPLF